MREREEVLREFGKLPRTAPGVYVHADTDAMADEIVSLRQESTALRTLILRIMDAMNSGRVGSDRILSDDFPAEITKMREALAACERVVEAANKWAAAYELADECGGSSEEACASSECQCWDGYSHCFDLLYKAVRAAVAAETKVDERVSDAYTLPRVTDEMVRAAHRVMLNGDTLIGTETVRAMLTAALDGPRDQ